MLRGSGCLVLLALASACGTSTDDRPPTLAFVTETILKPTCAQAECHSTFAQQKGYDFETVATARASFQNDPVLVDVDDIGTTTPPTLILNLTIEQGPGALRMPFDAPIPNADVDLIQKWMEAGLSGICPSGATTACLGGKVLRCVNDDAYELIRRCSDGPNLGTMCTSSASCGNHCAGSATSCMTMADCPLLSGGTTHAACSPYSCEIGASCPTGVCSNGACQ
jgi:hypothetical protein